MSIGRYEIIYILAPNTPEDTMNDLVARFESEITTGEGVLLRVEKWGRKKLAYEVRKFREGFFVLFVVDCQGELVTGLERRFRMTDQVIKFMTVRIDEEMKRAGKMPKDEELGKPVETERIDRSRRSGVKPPPRTGTPAVDDMKPATDTPAETETAEPTVSDEDAEEKADHPAVEASGEQTAETVEPVAEDDAVTTDDDATSDDK